jgi:hypothetical protein
MNGFIELTILKVLFDLSNTKCSTFKKTNHHLMRLLFTIACVFFVLLSDAQTAGKIMISGIVTDTNTFPIQGVAIINVKTGKITRTDQNGYFKTEFSVRDSILIYHIAYKKQFVNSSDSRKKFVLEPEVYELNQVNVNDKSTQTNRNIDSLEQSVTQLAPKKKLTGYDERSTVDYFVDASGSHNKGFSPYFGPSFKIPFGKKTSNVIKREEKRQIKEMTSHYHLVKTEKGK